MQLVHILDWYLVHSLLHYTPDTLIHWIYVMSLSWPHMLLLINGVSRYSSKFECVMCCCIVLLEDKHIRSNAADHSQQFLHQRHVPIIRPVDLSARLNENDASLIEFWCRSRDITDLLEVGRMRRLAEDGSVLHMRENLHPVYGYVSSLTVDNFIVYHQILISQQIWL